MFVASEAIATLFKVAEPVTPVVVIPAPVVPTVIDPAELLDGVIDVTVLNVLDPNTVALAVGPVITSVCALSDKSVPTIVNEYVLSSPLALVIDNLFPALSVKEPELIESPFSVNIDAVSYTHLTLPTICSV